MGTEVNSLRGEEAIGLVCNFACFEQVPGSASRRQGEGLRHLRPFSIARQYYKSLFEELARETGAELENFVYVKSKASHYIVMTPTKKSLLDSGIFKDPSRSGLESTNVDVRALDLFVRRVVSFRLRPGQLTLPEACGGVERLEFADGGPQLFDFSKLRRAKEGLSFFPPPPSAGLRDDRRDRHLLVALVGDALVEPFWPEGLGVVRGFLGALDVAHAAACWADGLDRDAVCSEFNAAYTQLKSLAAASRSKVLRDDDRAYSLDPRSRYRGIARARPNPAYGGV